MAWRDSKPSRSLPELRRDLLVGRRRNQETYLLLKLELLVPLERAAEFDSQDRDRTQRHIQAFNGQLMERLWATYRLGFNGDSFYALTRQRDQTFQGVFRTYFAFLPFERVLQAVVTWFEG